ncbi:MAG TPA: redoxin domain-containing protein [Candidatus Polarisedimenticolia bacterium]|nr:redoxin domain-containing protein [Candidatus Polarisedimenticolia bacterium]
MKWITLPPLLWMTLTVTTVAGRPATPNPTCELSPKVKAALKEANGKDDGSLTSTQLRAQRLARLRLLRERYPDDLFVHLRYQYVSKGAPDADLEPLIAEYRKRLENRPEDPLSRVLLASLLVGQETKESIELLEQVVRQEPDLARAHYELAIIANLPAYADKAKALAHLKRYMELCPSSLEAFGYIRAGDEPAFQESSARRLRALLRDRKDPDSLRRYETLWSLEFTTTPVVEHERLRARVADDLRRLRQVKHGGDEGFLSALDSGYQLTNDMKGRQWVEEQYVRYLPRSQATMMLVMDRFEREHPRPSVSETSDEMRRYHREILTASGDWVRRWPDEEWVWTTRLNAVGDLDDVAVEEVERTADGLLGALARNPGQQITFPPQKIMVADLYLRRNTRVDRIPDLVGQAFEEADKQTAALLASDRYPPSEEAMFEDGLTYVRWRGWPLLVQAYAKTSHPDKARETLARMWSALEQETKTKKEAPPEEHAMRAATYWESRGNLAEQEDRKLDALVSYQTALSLDSRDERTEDMKARIARLWPALGGTDEGWSAWRARSDPPSIIKEVILGSIWREKNQPLPDFTLTDVSGRSWRLSDLAGKVAFINVWSISCGPCRQEMPHLMKLYEQFKNDPGVIFLSLNVDADIGLVEPFAKQHGISFPVIPAAAYVEQVVEELSIPLNWVVDPNGVLLVEQVGFGADGEAWLKQAREKIDGARPKER